MILVTGATGFIGRVLVRLLAEAGHDVRVLMRPSVHSPALPNGVPVDAAVTGLWDPRGLRAAMVGVDVVYHLAGAERQGSRADLQGVDIRGTRAVAEAARDAGIDRIFTVSHLGADRASGYPLLKTKGIAEESLRKSGIDYTILRSAVLFGEGDSFTSSLACLAVAQPFFFAVPGDGDTVLQPLWVEDLATCLVWALDDDGTRNQTFDLGGPEYFSLVQAAEIVMGAIGMERRFLHTRPPYLRGLAVTVESLFPGMPVSTFWLDYLAINRTTGLDTLSRAFGLLPARFPSTIDYLKKTNWRRVLLRALWKRRKPGANGKV
ncbi:MAG TPA: NAD(P)H-binding protein [Anaerolineales bacterium]|nr:NAD(P)H-binding protein [Anaerolineales bacterium]